jgi:hypothetical protein
MVTLQREGVLRATIHVGRMPLSTTVLDVVTLDLNGS